MAIPIDNRQPSLTVTETIAAAGLFPSRDSFNDGMTLGMFHTYAFTFGLAGAPVAQGQIINIASNTALFSLLGTKYGGNGQTTFALPDLGGRAAISDGQGPGLSDFLLGQSTGSATSQLLPSQMPASFGGTSAPADDDGPELAVKYMIRAEGIYPSQGGGGSGRLDLIGSVVKFAGNFVPAGYFECNGQLLDIATYDALFSLIGTTYGGDGQTTFALPDLRGRVVVGAGGSYTLGQQFGQEDVTIGLANLPVEMGGGGQPIDNREPSLALNYAIALGGIFPSQSGGADPYDAMIGEIIVFAGDFAPRGFALCQGQLLPINQNQALFSLLGTTYGGNGQTTFALPDLRGRTAIGSGNGFIPGQTTGSDQVFLTLDHIPDLDYLGTPNPDTLYGGNGDDTIGGLAGDDTITGHGGADALEGGLGNDTYIVTDALDTLLEAANAGIDTVRVPLASYSLFFVANVERIVFTGAGNFVGRGNALDNRIQGGLGDDRFVADQGGADRYFGDAGSFDQMDFRPSAVGAIVNLTTGVHGGAAAGDFFSSIEVFYGSDTAGDTLTGDAFSNRLDGYGGNDTLVGLGGTDTLNGGNGDDEISGGLGLDFLRGGGGVDDFNYAALTDSGPTSGERDRIIDFVAGTDDIDVSAIDAAAATGANDAFTQFIGSAAFTAEGQVRWYQSGANTVIEFNTTGVSGAEMQIQLNNFTAANLTAGDFIG
jgi:microcystin-dependent protein